MMLFSADCPIDVVIDHAYDSAAYAAERILSSFRSRLGEHGRRFCRFASCLL